MLGISDSDSETFKIILLTKLSYLAHNFKTASSIVLEVIESLSLERLIVSLESSLTRLLLTAFSSLGL